MHVENVKHVDELNTLILQDLRAIGIKYRPKKNRHGHDTRNIYKDSRVFRRPLEVLKTQVVTLKCGIAVGVPAFVVEACNHIKDRCDVEGIFRKAGSAARLREIKTLVDNGKRLESNHHVVDVSNILKLFFRELPEPLLPFSFHDLLLRCLLLKDKAIDGILLACLLFPSIHINTMSYLMEFFQEVADHEELNKMSITNLAIILTPSLMPVDEKVVVNSGSRLGHHVRVIELLMKNTARIGIIPESLAEKVLNIACIGSASEEADGNDDDSSKSKKKKKKRRSGSLTRMINGLKKMVGKGSPEMIEQPITSTPDFSSPCLKSSKKRKLHESSGAFSNKKKREILQSLPQKETLANAPRSPIKGAARELCYTPRVNSHPNPLGNSESPVKHRKSKKFFSHKLQCDDNIKLIAQKSESKLKSRLHVGRKSGKKLKKGVDTDSRSPDTSARSEKAPRSSLDWQWKSGPWRRKKCLSSSDTPVFMGDLGAENRSSESGLCSDSTSCTTSVFDAGVDLSDSVTSSDSEFVKIPKSEYEAIKNRVSAIENRISQEFECIISDPSSLQDIRLIDESDEEICCSIKVQNAYEKTLEESERLNDPATTDQLAKRLSRELKIRHSFENKIIRSPSARKIGTIRRRSRESARNSSKASKSSPKRVVRHSSLRQDSSQIRNQDQIFYPKSNLRRGRPNTVFSGLPHPSPRIPPLNKSEEISPCNVTSDNPSFDRNSSNFSDMFTKPVSAVNNMSMYKTVQENADKLFENSCKAEIMKSSLQGGTERNVVRRVSSFQSSDSMHSQEYNSIICDLKKSNSQMDISCQTPVSKANLYASSSNNTTGIEKWENAPQFFRKPKAQDIPVSGRESVVKIRSQNAGMVLARMRLFDKMRGTDGTPSRINHIETGDNIKPFVKNTINNNNNHNSQSLRVQCIQDNFLEKINHQTPPAGGERRRSIRLQLTSSKDYLSSSPTSRGSPKKIGSPRKKYLSQKSPKVINKKFRPKFSNSPQKEMQNERSIKKFNSLRESSNRSPLTCKGNITAPSSFLDFGKENFTSTKSFDVCTRAKMNCEQGEKKSDILQHIYLPDNLKDTIYDVCTPKTEKLSKMSVSPLKDCNRIDVNVVSQFEMNRSTLYKTPKHTPYIKKPLLVKSPSDFSCTPVADSCKDSKLLRLTTPLKALPIMTTATPTVPPRSSPV